jgi:uncharacterized protein YbjT (DUF2867 family)
MSQKRVIAVVGATGAQGGGLVRAICADKSGPFKARALTRDVNSEKAKALAALGAEVVAADVDDEASLKRAFEGADAAFCVTFFWAHFSAEKELAEAAAMARAAKHAKLGHVIWSTLEDTRRSIPLSDNRMPTIHGKYKVPHFDGKGEANQLFADAGVPTTYLNTSFYWENFIYFGLEPKKGPDGVYALTIPMGSKKLPGIAAEDIGKCALGVYRLGGELIGKTIGIAGEHLTLSEIASQMSAAVGTEIKYNDVPFDVFRGFGFPGADDVGNMFQFKHDFNEAYVGARDIAFARKLNPELLSFKGWLAQNASKIPLK